jgi:hypothetical protein
MVSKEELRAILLKLLDKAGKDPRLTPRLLREKAEQRLKLEKGVLKAKREDIKRLIIRWWYENVEVNMDENTRILNEYIKIAKASGSALVVFKGLADMAPEEKISIIRTRYFPLNRLS